MDKLRLSYAVFKSKKDAINYLNHNDKIKSTKQKNVWIHKNWELGPNELTKPYYTVKKYTDDWGIICFTAKTNFVKNTKPTINSYRCNWGIFEY